MQFNDYIFKIYSRVNFFIKNFSKTLSFFITLQTPINIYIKGNGI